MKTKRANITPIQHLDGATSTDCSCADARARFTLVNGRRHTFCTANPTAQHLMQRAYAPGSERD